MGFDWYGIRHYRRGRALRWPGRATGRVVWPGGQRDGQTASSGDSGHCGRFQASRWPGLPAAIMASGGSGARWMWQVLLLNVWAQLYLSTLVLTLTALQRFGFCVGCTKNIPRQAASAVLFYRRRKISGCKVHQSCDTISPNKKRGLPHRVKDGGTSRRQESPTGAMVFAVVLLLVITTWFAWNIVSRNIEFRQ